MVQAQKKRYDGKKSSSDYNELNFVPRVSNPTFKRSGGYYVCGKPGHHAAQCHKRANMTKNENPPATRINRNSDQNFLVAKI